MNNCIKDAVMEMALEKLKTSSLECARAKILILDCIKVEAHEKILELLNEVEVLDFEEMKHTYASMKMSVTGKPATFVLTPRGELTQRTATLQQRINLAINKGGHF